MSSTATARIAVPVLFDATAAMQCQVRARVKCMAQDSMV